MLLLYQFIRFFFIFLATVKKKSSVDLNIQITLATAEQHLETTYNTLALRRARFAQASTTHIFFKNVKCRCVLTRALLNYA